MWVYGRISRLRAGTKVLIIEIYGNLQRESYCKIIPLGHETYTRLLVNA